MTKPKFKEQLSNEEQIENIINRANKEIKEEEKGAADNAPKIKKVNILFNNFIVNLNEKIAKLYIVFPAYKQSTYDDKDFIYTRIKIIDKQILLSCTPLKCFNEFKINIFIDSKFQGAAEDTDTAVRLLKSTFVEHYKSIIRKNNKK